MVAHCHHRRRLVNIGGYNGTDNPSQYNYKRILRRCIEDKKKITQERNSRFKKTAELPPRGTRGTRIEQCLNSENGRGKRLLEPSEKSSSYMRKGWNRSKCRPGRVPGEWVLRTSVNNPNHGKEIGKSCKNVMMQLLMCDSCKREVRKLSDERDQSNPPTNWTRQRRAELMPDDFMISREPVMDVAKYGLPIWGLFFTWDIYRKGLSPISISAPEDPRIPHPARIHTIWGRKFSIRPSKVDKCGLGVFAEQDILVETKNPNTGWFIPVELFPYVGQTYPADSRSKVRKWLETFPSYGRYFLCIRNVTQKTTPNRTFIGGFPIRNSNIAGFINTNIHSVGVERNVDFIAKRDGETKFKPKAKAMFGDHVRFDYPEEYIMTVALKTIRKGEELISHYNLVGGISNIPVLDLP